MPHVTVEFSPNVTDWGNPAEISKAIHDVLCANPDLPADAVKTRSVFHTDVHLGRAEDGLNGFAAILIRTRPGRSDQVLQAISASVRDAVVAAVTPVQGRTFTISVDIQMMNPVTVAQAKI